MITHQQVNELLDELKPPMRAMRRRLKAGQPLTDEDRQILAYAMYCLHMKMKFKEARHAFNLKVYLDRTEALRLAVKTDPPAPPEYFVASVFILAEAYDDLNLYDPTISRLLQSPHYRLLERFRNAVFHFQKDTLSPKITDFITLETFQWMAELYRELKRYITSISTPPRVTIGNAFESLSALLGEQWPSVLAAAKSATATAIGMAVAEFDSRFDSLKATVLDETQYQAIQTAVLCANVKDQMTPVEKFRAIEPIFDLIVEKADALRSSPDQLR